MKPLVSMESLFVLLSFPRLSSSVFLFFFFLKGVFLACTEEQRTGSLDAGQSGADGVQASHAVLPVKTPLS